MDVQTECLIPPGLSVTSTKALGEWVLASAASQGEWPIMAHQEFLDEMSSKVSDAADRQLSLVLPPDAPSDPVFFAPPRIAACATEIEPFEHAMDIDFGEPDIQPDPSLLARGKRLCSQCPVRSDCLTSGVQSLKVQDGLYGGLTKQERQPIWRQNFDERLVQLQRAYTPLGDALSKFIQESDKKDEIRDVLIALRRQFTNAATAEDKGLHVTRQLDPALRVALVNPVITERAQWLLPHAGRIVMQRWVAACQEFIDPFNYDFGAGKTIWAQTVRRAERQVTTTLRELAAGEFNYRCWVKQSPRVHNPITFLVTIGELVPDGDIEALKQIGRQKLSLLPRTRKGSRTKLQDIGLLLMEYYGLGEDGPAENQTLARKYDVGEAVIAHAVRVTTRRIKKLCGNLENDDDEP